MVCSSPEFGRSSISGRAASTSRIRSALALALENRADNRAITRTGLYMFTM